MFDKINVTCDKLKTIAFKKLCDIEERYYQKTDYKKDNNPPKNGWVNFPNNTKLSGSDKHFWIKLNFKTPKFCAGKSIILNTSTGFEGAENTLNPQGMVFVDGRLLQALDTNHTQVKLEPNKNYEMFIYLYNGMTDAEYEFRTILIEVDDETEQLYYDIFVPFLACKDVYTENSFEYANIIKILSKACNMLELNYPYSSEYYGGISAARKYIRSEFYDKMCGNNMVTVNCVGHTHIDVAWLWTLAQTREKIQRSSATAISLMEQYPEYKFMMSQPQLFKFLSETDPEMYDRIKELVKEGRWELEGAMWLEADCNLTSGESLVRQILHGKRFLKEEFGVDSEILWLPDVFGYSAAMPQILKKCGIKHFVTSKISWNDTNTMPYDTFMWQGIDGTEIITDFITVQNFKRGGEFDNHTTYIGEINPSMVAGTWNRYQQKEYNNEVLLVYGFGDGGGGPTRDMLEQQRRLSFGFPNMPKTHISTLKDHLEIVEKNFDKVCLETGKTPKWIGELYLEFHRGTYTSMAKNKRYNRICEMLMQKTESLSAIKSVFIGSDVQKQELYSLWDIILLNQFHDIIPGSSIKEVYEESHKQYENVLAKCKEISTSALKTISDNIVCEDGILVYNSLGFERKDIITVDGVTYETPNIPSYGWKVFKPNQIESKVSVNAETIENEFYILTLDSAGRISRLFDKRYNREVLSKEGFANEFQIFEDFPSQFDNWEISPYYKDKCKILNENAQILTIDEGCRKGFKIVKNYKTSTITQYIYLYDTIERIDVKNVIDWHEHNQLVKIAFPVNIHTNYVNYDIQFGNIQRNNNTNTSWDTAKFEVCGHKWVDVSEFGYGVSILNDCKYGFNTEENILKLTAIKCGTFPNEEADQGIHEFTYSIYPHKGDFREGETIKAAYCLNQPLECISVEKNQKGRFASDFSFIKCDCENIIIDTVKQSEDDNSIIVRLFDSFNCKSNPTLSFGIPIDKVYICDMLENVIEECSVIDNNVNLSVNNFEVLTIKITTP